ERELHRHGDRVSPGDLASPWAPGVTGDPVSLRGPGVTCREPVSPWGPVPPWAPSVTAGTQCHPGHPVSPWGPNVTVGAQCHRGAPPPAVPPHRRAPAGGCSSQGPWRPGAREGPRRP
uniref:Uncharacterized protein n=1 Tax=Nothoprocta perdicaria TaxID=30464 RepID=A0A8C6ZPM1_NOTPE